MSLLALQYSTELLQFPTIRDIVVWDLFPCYKQNYGET